MAHLRRRPPTSGQADFGRDRLVGSTAGGAPPIPPRLGLDFVTDLPQQKLAQAVELLAELDFDLWLTFARESSLSPDPALEVIGPLSVTWPTAVLISRNGERLAILGRHDAANAERLGSFTEVIGYDESIGPALVAALRRLNPQRVAVNFSLNDPAADGLSAGMERLLSRYLGEAGIPADRLESSESLIAHLRGRKLPSERALIQRAIATTEEIFELAGGALKHGMSEVEVADWFHQTMRERNLDYAWEPRSNPLVNIGPESTIGHARPGEERLQAGRLVHVDFGIKQDGYCSDLQRTWYAPLPGETRPPETVDLAWQASRAALLAGAAAMRPGAQGWEVDAAARAALVDHGYPEYTHAFGHNLGTLAHDGGTVLGPRWDRYGRLPYGRLELGVEVDEYGPVYLEENVALTLGGLEWLSSPQTEIWMLRPEVE
jgi:Xaa-Pro aminopeptidase